MSEAERRATSYQAVGIDDHERREAPRNEEGRVIQPIFGPHYIKILRHETFV